MGYQLSPHTHTQQHHTLDYYNSTPYMYIHIFGRSGPSVVLIWLLLFYTSGTQRTHANTAPAYLPTVHASQKISSKLFGLCCTAISSLTKYMYIQCTFSAVITTSVAQCTREQHQTTQELDGWGTCIYRPGGASESLKQSQGTHVHLSLCA